MLLKKSFCHPLTLALATVATCTLAGAASAATFNFSFSNVGGGTSGTVQGTLTLPDGDGTFSASSIIVNSAPAALGYTLPYDVLASLPSLLVNSFTVSGGAITAGNFAAQNNTDAFTLALPDVGSFFNLPGTASAESGVWDATNSTLTFSSPAPVPEPATVLGLLSVAGVGLLSKRQKQEK